MITKEELNELEKKYLANKKNIVLENALSSNELKKVIKVPSAKQNTINKFSTNIKTLKVTDQYRSGRCWLFAGLNVIRESIAKKYNLEDFELSQNYLSFYDKLEKANYYMDTVINMGNKAWDSREIMWLGRDGYSEGGTWTMFQNLVEKYGVVPKDTVTETFQALNSNQMIDLVYKTLKEFTYTVNSKNLNEKKKIKKAYLEKIYNFLTMCYGRMPKTFTFEYVDKDKKYHKINDLTPQRFYKECTDFKAKDYVCLLSIESNIKKYNTKYRVKYVNNMSGTEDTTYININIKDFKKAIKKQLDDGEVVWFGCDCLPYLDRDKGTWDIKGYDYKTAFDIDLKAKKGDMLDYGISAPNHAMVITGYNKSPARWKIENSWGEKSGDKGYYVATDEWFDLYTYYAAVNKKYLNDETKKLLDKKETILNPWDPLGTLAK